MSCAGNINVVGTAIPNGQLLLCVSVHAGLLMVVMLTLSHPVVQFCAFNLYLPLCFEEIRLPYRHLGHPPRKWKKKGNGQLSEWDRISFVYIFACFPYLRSLLFFCLVPFPNHLPDPTTISTFSTTHPCRLTSLPTTAKFSLLPLLLILLLHVLA